MQRGDGADSASVHVIDHDSRRRAEISRELMARGGHAEIYEDMGEFLRALPDRALVLLVERPDRNVLAEFLEAARERGRYFPVALYSDTPQPELVVRAMREGAIDYLHWPFAAALLEAALQRLADEGERRRKSEAMRAEARSLVGQLTPREHDVLVSMLNGNSNKQIAAELSVSPRTVEIYRKNVMRKFDARSASEAVRIGIYADLWELAPA
jgi:two-component system, LuxR family, response regulator FixJ